MQNKNINLRLNKYIEDFFANEADLITKAFPKKSQEIIDHLAEEQFGQMKHLNMKVTDQLLSPSGLLEFKNALKEEMNNAPTYTDERTYTVNLSDLKSFKDNIKYLNLEKLEKLDEYLFKKIDDIPGDNYLIRHCLDIEKYHIKRNCYEDFKEVLQAEIDSRNTIESVPRNVFDDVSAFLDELDR